MTKTLLDLSVWAYYRRLASFRNPMYMLLHKELSSYRLLQLSMRLYSFKTSRAVGPGARRNKIQKLEARRP